MRTVETIKAITICVVLLLVAACEAKTPQGLSVSPESAASASTDTAVPLAIMESPTDEGPGDSPTAVPPPTATPRPSPTPIPTPRPLAEGECIAWHEAPSFVGHEICVEGKVNFIRSANPARTLFFLVVDPSVPDIDHCCGLLYGWLYAKRLYDTVPTGGMSKLFEGKCVRLHGTIEKGEGHQYLVPIKAQDQLEIVECSECQIPEACGL